MTLRVRVHSSAVETLLRLEREEHRLAEVAYPPEPDCDGSVRRGWRVLGPGVGGVDHFAIGAVEPCWMEFHK